jgi:hypothetical protein
MDQLLKALVRTSLRRGFGGERAWLLLALGVFVVRRIRRPEDKVLLSMPIKAGDRFAVTLSDPDAPFD